MDDKSVSGIRFAGFAQNLEVKKLGDIADIVRGASLRTIRDPKWLM